MTRRSRQGIFRGSVHWIAFFAAGLVLGAIVIRCPAQDAGKADNINSIFPVAPRELRQHLTRAQSALDEQRFSDAVAELGEILNSAEGDDYFLGAAGGVDAQVSLKSQALSLLGSMPAKGRQMYELQYGAEARAALEDALTAGDLPQLTDVSRRYFHTKSGYEATLLLGRYQLDQGRPLAAALTLKRVADVPFAAAQYDPELSILLATCWVHANQPEQATETLVALKKRQPGARIKLVEGDAPLFASDGQALSWLEQIVGGGRLAPSAAATQWVMFRGSETRNAATHGGVPLLNFNWTQRTVNDPSDEDKMAQLLRATRDRGDPVIPALQPLVVQDCVVVRHPDTNHVAGISLRTGKIVWVYPPTTESPELQAARLQSGSSRTPIENIRQQELKQRIWEDNAFGQASSDGRQVYVIDELGYAPMVNVSVPQFIVAAGGRRIPNAGWSKQDNLLIALDLKREGYSVWAVGGRKGDNPALTGAFFLGAPLPLGDQLFALAEQSGDIRLVCLSSKDGSLEWKQQLAVVEDYQQIMIDRVRRLAGASPSYADGILVCPTSAGAVVAVDLVTRSLRWGYQYPRWDAVRNTQAAMLSNNQAGRGSNQDHWLDSTATIDSGCVVLTPVESRDLHCLDLLSGKARWPAQDRDDMLFVGCIHQGKIILVGKKKLKAVNLSDGAPAWPAVLDLGNEVPTGRGYYSGNHYFLPVSGQHLLKIDLEKGQVVGRAKTETDLGNVVCYKDQLISQGPQFVASFFLSEPLQKQLDERLRINPNDADALALQGQVLLQEGQAAESLAVLRRAREHAPASEPIRSLLVKVMLALLRDDFDTHLALTEELDGIATDPAQRREALRWRVKGLTHTGHTWEAFQAVLELADLELADVSTHSRNSANLDPVERDLVVRNDRWLQGRLHELLRAADADTRPKMRAEIEVRLQRVLQSGSTSQLRSFLNLFGFQDASHAARLALADQLITADQLLEAELLVGELLDVADPAVAGPTRAALASIYERAARPDLAARYYHLLAAEYAAVVCREGLTGQQLAERAAKSEAVGPFYQAAAWPTGLTEVEKAPAGAAAMRVPGYQRQSYAVALTQFFGAAPRGLKAQYDQTQSQITIRDDRGQTLASAQLRGADSITRRSYGMPPHALSGKAHGHLVLMNCGTEVVAIDALRGERANVDSLLWRQESADLDPTGRGTIYPQQRSVSNKLIGPKFVTYDPTGRLSFSSGPVQSTGYCYLKGRQLICVDPLTGQSVWERSQVPLQAEVFGDGELIFVADASGDEVLALSAIDGSLLGKRKLDRADRRWTTHGRRVLAWDQVGSTFKIRLYDAWEQDAAGSHLDLWSATVADGTRACLIDGEELALLEPSGQFTVVSLATGELRFAVPLDPEPALDYLQVQRSREQYVLLTTQSNYSGPPGLLPSPVGTAANSPQARVHGRAYAFSRTTGKLQWQVPAFIAAHCLPVDQPAESPLLFFVRNQTDQRVADANNKSTAHVLCLDKRDGRIVFDGNAGPQSAHCEIVADPLKHVVSLSLVQNNMPIANYLFRVSDKPAPPQPPAQTGETASTSVGEAPGVADPSVGVAVENLKGGANPFDFAPPPPPVRGIPPRPR